MEKKTCFVIMPFSSARAGEKDFSKDELTYIYEEIIRKAVGEYKNEGKTIFDEITRFNAKVGSIVAGIAKNLNSSDLVVADLTGLNPNVMYELGVRHTLKRGTIIITQNINTLPSDLRDYLCVEYKFPNAAIEYGRCYDEFKSDIHKAIDEIFSTNKYDSPVLFYLKGREQYWKEDELKLLKKNTIVFNYILDHYDRVKDLIEKTQVDENAVHYKIYGSMINNICFGLNDLDISIESSVLYEDIQAAISVMQEFNQKFGASEHFDNYLGGAGDEIHQALNLQRTSTLDFEIPNYFLLNEDKIGTMSFRNVFSDDGDFYQIFLAGMQDHLDKKSLELGLTETEIEQMTSH